MEIDGLSRTVQGALQSLSRPSQYLYPGPDESETGPLSKSLLLIGTKTNGSTYDEPGFHRTDPEPPCGTLHSPGDGLRPDDPGAQCGSLGPGIQTVHFLFSNLGMSPFLAGSLGIHAAAPGPVETI